MKHLINPSFITMINVLVTWFFLMIFILGLGFILWIYERIRKVK